jgi:hypothetical protein
MAAGLRARRFFVVATISQGSAGHGPSTMSLASSRRSSRASCGVTCRSGAPGSGRTIRLSDRCGGGSARGLPKWVAAASLFLPQGPAKSGRQRHMERGADQPDRCSAVSLAGEWQRRFVQACGGQRDLPHEQRPGSVGSRDPRAAIVLSSIGFAPRRAYIESLCAPSELH